MRVTGGMKARVRFQNPSSSLEIKRDNMENPPLLCLSDLQVYDSGSVFFSPSEIPYRMGPPR